MTPDNLKAEMRLTALENMVAQACIMCARIVAEQEKITEGEAVEILRSSAIAASERVTFPELDPVLSDAAAGELTDAMRRLLDLIAAQKHGS